jgi:UDP-N-acetylglucosamine acyltransferase
MSIDPTAQVSSSAELGAGIRVGPYAVIEGGVTLGDGCDIGAHAVLKNGLRLGSNVRVFEGAVLGGEPQDLKFRGADSFAEIGDGSLIREFATVHRSAVDGGVTRLGRHCLLMAYGHVAHDCQIGDHAIIASYVALAGHIQIESRAFVSGGVVVHQFTHIGELSMIGGGSKINLDVPPYFTVDGVPGRAIGLNVVGLKRAGLGEDAIRTLKSAFRILYRSKLPLREALERIEAIDTRETRHLVEFIRSSERGICRHRPQRR